MEVYHDARVYDTGMITILEIMGRNAGWLTAASALAAHKGNGPDLIYLPELAFDMDQFLEDTAKIYDKSGKVIVAVSEGAKTKDGKYIAELASENLAKDSFGHSQLGGTANVLANMVQGKIAPKVRGIEFSLLQRCAAHVASKTDIEESFLAGQTAVRAAVEGNTDYMVAFERAEGSEYICNTKLLPLSKVANTEKKVPREWINKEGNGILPAFVDYALPLIQGQTDILIEDGLPRFAKLNKVLATK